MSPRIKIIAGVRTGDEFAITSTRPLILGRDRSLEAALPEQKISRRHAQIIATEEPSFQLILEDLGSLNGTYLNDQKISGPIELSDGDKIRIGPIVMEVSIPFSKTNPGFQLEPHESFIQRKSDSKHRESVIPNTSPQNAFDLAEPHQAEQAYESFVQAIDEELESNETGGRLISGKIEELALPDVLQMLQTTRKSGILAVGPDRLAHLPMADTQTAVLVLDQGALTSVAYRGLENEEAFYTLLKLEKGFFALFPPQNLPTPNPMQTPIEALLIEGMRRLDEEKEAAQNLSPEDRFEARPDEPLEELSKEELKIFQIIWKHHEVKAIMSRSPFDASQTEQIIRKLLRNQFIRKIH